MFSWWLPGLDPAAGLLVAVVVLVVLVVGKEQGGRVIRGPRGSACCRACCSPGRADLGPGCFTWCRAWCRIAGGVAALLGAGPAVCRVILRQLPGLDPAAGFLVVLVAVVAVAALVALFFVRGLCPGPVRCFWPCCRSPSVRIAAGVPCPSVRPGDPRAGWFHLAPGLLSARSCRSRPGVLHLVPDRRRRCRVILRQLRGLDPVSGLLVAVVAVPVLAGAGLVIGKKRSFFFLCLRFVRVRGWPPGQKKTARQSAERGEGKSIVVAGVIR